MNTPTYVKFNSREERIAAWKSNREAYTAWRKTAEARRWIVWVRKKQQQLCFICVTPLDEAIHVDHIFPLYLGGTNSKLNLCVTHPKCNMDKGAKVYTTYKQACCRRAQFNRIRKAKRVLAMLEANPKLVLSKKNKRAIRLYRELSSSVSNIT